MRLIGSNLKTVFPALLVGLAAMTSITGSCARADGSSSPEISVVCDADAAVSSQTALQLCEEAVAVLQSRYPDRVFRIAESVAPVVHLTVTHANERGAGLGVIWQAADGSKTTGMTLKTSFYDKSSDEQMRRTFLTAFFQHNPLPF